MSCVTTTTCGGFYRAKQHGRAVSQPEEPDEKRQDEVTDDHRHAHGRDIEPEVIGNPGAHAAELRVLLVEHEAARAARHVNYASWDCLRS